MTFIPTPHPILRIPTPDDIQRIAWKNQIDPQKAYIMVMRRREELIRLEKSHALKYGWEPKIYKICDAILGLPFVDAAWAARVRAALGLKTCVRMLLILGGNRAGKSEYAAKRSVMMLLWREARRAWMFHSTSQMSVEYQQRLIYKYFPNEYKSKDIRSKSTYIAYKDKTGFSEGSFILPNKSAGSFRYYEQALGTLEGGELDWVWMDEHAPPEYIETVMLRLATRDGCGVVTFTPTQGYSPACKLFLDGHRVVRESAAYLCPRDEGEPREDLALIPENVDQWLETDFVNEVPGRKFEKVPRVSLCVDPKKAIIYFHSSDNPFGNPRVVVDIIRTQPRTFIKERFYGVPNKTMSSRFPKFDNKVHVLKAHQIPKAGTNYHFVDPASGRNFFMAWVRVTPEGVYFYRQWPGPYEIPGYGMLGPWALPDGRKPDGRPGPAQDVIGFGLKDYRDEIARLEGWKRKDGTEEFLPELAEEKIYQRRMDSRFASSPKLENDRPITIIEEFDKLGLYFEPTPGENINEGVTIINDWLNYDREKPIDFLNKPKCYVSEECPDIIFAMQSWTGADGQKGACKDPADIVRYVALSGVSYVTQESWAMTGGGSY